MAREIPYENTMRLEANVSSASHKRTVFIIATTLLAFLALLLATLLIAGAILYFQKEKELRELEGVVERIGTSLKLSNISRLASGEASEGAQLLENIHEAFSEIQAQLENISVSRAAAQHRYKAKQWGGAEETCRAQRAHLASITSRKEMEYLSKEARGKPFWIGLSDHQAEGTWAWTDGTKYNKNISFWGPGQPDNWHGAPQHQEDCVQVTDFWNDVSCTYSYRAFCKKTFS
ncbi:asialoglycoprotein receptor 1-like isoform X2 [Rhineura floridana]|uniref:asialoglycoprotein receptor 1-like isoform X2 n=1 Tax=Rhineura floridana TaxID=261503 RepID=UPI002AC88839|nr:asialoglycoprotein receptor 1-like isoform X2 [Rhineura floridana]